MLKEILTAPTEELGRWSRFAIFQLRLWRQCIRLLQQNRCGMQAAALSYHTLFGIVPLAIVMLMVFQSFPAYQDVGLKARQRLYEYANLDKIEYQITDQNDPLLPTNDNSPVNPPTDDNDPNTIKLTDQIDKIAENFISRLDTGALTLFSGAFVIWAAIGLLGTIERSFNNIWHSPRSRSFVHRIVNYWALLTLGPLLLGLGIYVSTHYLTQTHIEASKMEYIRPLFTYGITVVALFFLYFVMPNTKVSIKAAIWAALVAALLWTGAKHAFGLYIIRFVPQQRVYGVMGLIPLGVMWIYVTWLIVLFGLQLTYATQHLKTLDAAEIAKMRKSDEYFIANDITVIKIMAYIAQQFQARKCPVTPDTVSAALEIPADFTEKILEHLVNTKLLFQTAEPETGYSPATDADKITLASIAEAVRKASFGTGKNTADDKLKSILAAQQTSLSKHTLKDILTEKSSDESTDEAP